MSNVLVLKLSTGEEIIGDVTTPSEGVVHVEFGLLLHYEMQDGGKLGFGFLPYAPLVDKNKNINQAHIVWSAEPTESLLNAYKQATGKVVTPTTKILAPGSGLLLKG
jgi:hypothetical protein